MKAIIHAGKGGSDELRLAEVVEPTVGAGEILIAVHRSGVNYADLNALHTGNNFLGAKPKDRIPGGEVVGRRYDTGRRVVAICGSGGYAEKVAAPETPGQMSGSSMSRKARHRLAPLICAASVRTGSNVDMAVSTTRSANGKAQSICTMTMVPSDGAIPTCLKKNAAAVRSLSAASYSGTVSISTKRIPQLRRNRNAITGYHACISCKSSLAL